MIFSISMQIKIMANFDVYKCIGYVLIIINNQTDSYFKKLINKFKSS